MADPHLEQVSPPILSWGKLPPHDHEQLLDEFDWPGTRDPAALLSLPHAIEFMQPRLEAYRAHGHQLVHRFAAELKQRYDLPGLVEGDLSAWTGTMATVPLPPANAGDSWPTIDPLQLALWEKFRIEVPIIHWQDRRWIRVSAHLYNHWSQYERLLGALGQLIE